jgi:hypothetical protein
MHYRKRPFFSGYKPLKIRESIENRLFLTVTAYFQRYLAVETRPLKIRVIFGNRH